MSLRGSLDRQVHPSQLYGLETNIYAQELASVVVWIPVSTQERHAGGFILREKSRL